MPNYRSKMLTFLSLGEMSSMLLDNTDEDGIFFAVATDATNFKIVMWRKNSTATVDNDLVYPANGPGRWHVLETGSSGSGIGGDIVQIHNLVTDSGSTSLPARGLGKQTLLVNKTSASDSYDTRTLTYMWNGSAWQFVSGTNRIVELGCGIYLDDKEGDYFGQIIFDKSNDPARMYFWYATYNEWILIK
jgi:hypothetical protein